MPTEHRNILIVDDEPTSLSLLKFMFKNHPYNIYTAANGKEGVEVVLNNRIDFMIVDYTMPIMDGITMIEKLKNLGKNIPFIMLSATNLECVIRKASEIGSAYFLNKPEHLKQDIAAMIETKIGMEKIKCRKLL